MLRDGQSDIKCYRGRLFIAFLQRAIWPQRFIYMGIYFALSKRTLLRSRSPHLLNGSYGSTSARQFPIGVVELAQLTAQTRLRSLWYR